MTADSLARAWLAKERMAKATTPLEQAEAEVDYRQAMYDDIARTLGSPNQKLARWEALDQARRRLAALA